MATTDAWAKHYAHLSGEERFRLQIEAMARGDRVEEGRVTDACPVVTVRCEDPQFRRRMHISFNAAVVAALNMREGLSHIRMAALFSRHCHLFRCSPVWTAQAAFLYGRALGRRECGADFDEVPDREAVRREIDASPELRESLAQVEGLAELELEDLADCLLDCTGRAFAADVLTIWEGFGRFCRDTLELEPLTMMRAWGLMKDDPAEQVREIFPEAAPRVSDAEVYGEQMASSWRRRFGGG